MLLAQIKPHYWDLYPSIPEGDFMKVITQEGSQVYVRRHNGEERSFLASHLHIGEYTSWLYSGDNQNDPIV